MIDYYLLMTLTTQTDGNREGDQPMTAATIDSLINAAIRHHATLTDSGARILCDLRITALIAERHDILGLPQPGTV